MGVKAPFLSLAFLLGSCNGVEAAPAQPSQRPPATAPANDAVAGVCAPAATDTLPPTATARLREINTALRALPAPDQAFFNFSHLVICDNIVKPGEPGMGFRDAAGNMMIALQPEAGRTGRDVYDLLEAQTAAYNAFPFVLNHRVEDNVRLSRLAMGHRFWHIAEAAEDMAAAGQPALRDFLLSDAARNADELILSHAAKFAAKYHEVRATETDPGKAFVKLMQDWQGTPGDQFAVFDGMLVLGYFDAAAQADTLSGATLGQIKMPADYPGRFFPDMRKEDLAAIFALPVTSSVEPIAKGLELLRDPRPLLREFTPEPAPLNNGQGMRVTIA